MYIHEAVKRAMEVNGCMYRPHLLQWFFKPTHIRRDISVITQLHPEPRHRWQPKAEDLMADDWEVTTLQNYKQRNTEQEVSIVRDKGMTYEQRLQRTDRILAVTSLIISILALAARLLK